MYTIIALTLIAAFCALTLFLPFRFPARLVRPLRALWERRFAASWETSFEGQGDPRQREALWVRIWGVTAALTFAAIGLAHGRLAANDPDSVLITLMCASAAIVLSAFVTLTGAAYVCFLPRAVAYSALRRSGVRSLAVADMHESHAKLTASLSRKIQESSMVACVDVTGFRLLGKGPGASGGLLYDALDAARNVPVYLLICKPAADTADPERKVASVQSNLLSEMDLSEAVYLRRLRQTLEAVTLLNQSRPQEAQIQVRYYAEKPTFQAILLDDSAFVLPWQPREENGSLPLLEIARETSDPSLYESLRRHFARVWSTPLRWKALAASQEIVTGRDAALAQTPWKASRNGSSRIRRRESATLTTPSSV